RGRERKKGGLASPLRYDPIKPARPERVAPGIGYLLVNVPADRRTGRVRDRCVALAGDQVEGQLRGDAALGLRSLGGDEPLHDRADLRAGLGAPLAAEV